MKKLRVGVIFGGRSGEHEVSIRTARAVIDAIDQRRYEVVPIAITKEGNWLSPAVGSLLFPEDTQARLSDKVTSDENLPLALIGDAATSGLLSTREDRKSISNRSLDVVFPALHGTYGEDGTIQGWLEMVG